LRAPCWPGGATPRNPPSTGGLPAPPYPAGGGPVGRVACVVFHRPVGPEKQQGQRVLARELPARARAPVGGTGQVDDGAIRRGGAATALTPQRARLGGAGR